MAPHNRRWLAAPSRTLTALWLIGPWLAMRNRLGSASPPRTAVRRAGRRGPSGRTRRPAAAANTGHQRADRPGDVERPQRAAALGLVALLFVAACSDDDDGAGSFSTELAAYCNAALAIELLPDPDVDFETASEDEVAAAVRTWLSQDLRPLLDEVRPLLPDEIRAPATGLLTTFQAIEKTGDIALFDDPSVAEAIAAIHAFDLDNCGWGHTDLTAVDYGFEGSLPTAAGVTSLDFTNVGEEFHVAVVARLEDSAGVSAEEAFAGVESEQQLDEAFDVVTSTEFAPGASNHAVVDLTAGEYVLFCPVPTGSVGGAPGDGPPHFSQGMVETFTVE